MRNTDEFWKLFDELVKKYPEREKEFLYITQYEIAKILDSKKHRTARPTTDQQSVRCLIKTF
jgi:hypothetical protein